ncbi:MAG: cell division protein ZapB [Treponema sp.]|nr:cell division protein ZapB [Treponema sp.]
MNTLEQFTLLEQKIESAVAKIQQLQAENDALRNKCKELTNALSSQSEQLSFYQADKGKIETGIQKALDRLNSIENTILKTDDQSIPFFKEPTVTEEPSITEETIIPSAPVEEQEVTFEPEIEEEPVVEQTTPSFSTPEPLSFSNQTAQQYSDTIMLRDPEDETPQFGNQNFDSMNVLGEETIDENDSEDDENNNNEFGFDIF